MDTAFLAGGLSGLTGGALAGYQIGAGMQDRKAQQARQQQIMNLTLMEREGSLYDSAMKAMELPPAQRKIHFALADEQLKKIQAIRGQEPIGLGDAFMQLAVKADEEQVPIFQAMMDGTFSEYIKGNPKALQAFRDPVGLMGKYAEFSKNMETANTQKEIRKQIEPLFGDHVAAVNGKPAATPEPTEPTMGQGPAPAGLTVNGAPRFTGSEGFRSFATTPPPVAPTAAPAAPPMRRGLPAGTSVNMGPQGLSLTTRGLTTKVDEVAREVGPGMVQRFRIFSDEAGGTREEPIGQPVPQGDWAKAHAYVTGTLGLEPGTPPFQAAMSRLIYAPESSRPLVMEKMEAGRGGGVNMGDVNRTQRTRAIEDDAEKARRVKKATEGEEPLGGEISGVVGPQTAALGMLEQMERTFKREELESFAGLGNKTREDVVAAYKGIGGSLGLPVGQVNKKYQDYKSMLAGIKQVITTAISGKTMTPYEGSNILASIPTGDEPGGPTEFFAKWETAKRNLMISREVRLELAKQGKGALTPEAIDAAVRARLEGGGASVGTVGGPGIGKKDPLGIR